MIHFLKLFSLLDEHFKVLLEVHFVGILGCLYEDLFLEELHGFIHNVC